ncbi:MAG: GSU2403 family nucleotidyltransferase fold protein, partial [Burkholderiales bacterium]
MAATFQPFTDESLRIAANLEQRHDAWIESVRRLDALPSSMFWVAKGEREYLGVKRNTSDPGTTEGVRSAETEARIADYQRERESARSTLSTTEAALHDIIRQYKALRLPIATPMPARILRELDIEGLLGADLMLVGTNAFAAYEIAATSRFPPEAIAETEDFDMAWCRGSSISLSGANAKPVGAPVMRALRNVDAQFRINARKPYQALSADGYQVELLVAPSLFRTFSDDEPFKPLAAFQEQEWLLRGTPVRAVIVSRDNKTCPIFAPDPRWMALHKLW